MHGGIRPRANGRVGAGVEDRASTETWTDDRRAWPAFAANAFDRLVTSGKTFAEFQVRNIETTLRNLKRELEQAHTP